MGTLCNGNYYRYWAWGSGCVGEPIDGSLPGFGPVPIRIGPALSNPPNDDNYYVIRELVGSTYYYRGYVNGTLLSGLNALGDTAVASVPASEICWNESNGAIDRGFLWFGETWNEGDSMGGWVGSSADNLDYTTLRYSINTGWLNPGHSHPATCTAQTHYPPYRCKKTGPDQLFITTTR